MQAVDGADNCDETLSTANVSPPSTDETRSSTPELLPTSHSTDPAHDKSTATAAQSATTSFDVGPSSRRDVDDRGRRDQLAVQQRSFVPQQASTEASDPSQHRRPVCIKPADQYRPSDEVGVVDVDDLNVVDANVDDCLVTSLRAEVR